LTKKKISLYLLLSSFIFEHFYFLHYYMNILYVCTGNIFRSMSAEYITKKYIKDHHIPNISVSSAGTRARPEQPFPRTLEKLKTYGIDASAHQQTKISPELLAEQDIIVCMAEHHRQSVREL